MRAVRRAAIPWRRFVLRAIRRAAIPWRRFVLRAVRRAAIPWRRFVLRAVRRAAIPWRKFVLRAVRSLFVYMRRLALYLCLFSRYIETLEICKRTSLAVLQSRAMHLGSVKTVLRQTISVAFVWTAPRVLLLQPSLPSSLLVSQPFQRPYLH